MDATVHMETIQIGLGCHGYLVGGAASILVFSTLLNCKSVAQRQVRRNTSKGERDFPGLKDHFNSPLVVLMTVWILNKEI